MAEQRVTHWYLWDILLVAAILPGNLYALQIGHYIAGLRNDIALAFTLSSVVVFVVWPVVLVCLIVLTIRMGIVWPRRIGSRRKSWTLRLCILAALAGYLALPFTLPARILPPGYIAGFRRYVQKSVDVQSVQQWLKRQDPNDCLGQTFHLGGKGQTGPVWLDTIAWPEAITHLDPFMVGFGQDEGGRLTIRLVWAPFVGTWGIEIGPEDMEIPKTQERIERWYGPPGRTQVQHDPGEYRLPLAPGAYVWHEIQ